ncbi:MAG: L-fucose mutarotase [Anaerolineaceae bacterium]
MLIGISPLISPDLLSTLCRMGHGDEIVLSDAHFPGESVNSRVLRADGIKVIPLLAAILPLFKLDESVDFPVTMMAPTKEDTYDPRLFEVCTETIQKIWPDTPPINFIERQAFYEQAKKTFAVVVTGETTKYGNIILKKGVTPIN